MSNRARNVAIFDEITAITTLHFPGNCCEACMDKVQEAVNRALSDIIKGALRTGHENRSKTASEAPQPVGEVKS